MKPQDYIASIEDKKNNNEAEETSLRSIIKEIQRYLRQEEQKTGFQTSTEIVRNRIIEYITNNINNWNIKDFKDREGNINTQKLISKVFDAILNYGKIQPLIENPLVTEVTFNGRYIWYEQDGRRKPYYDENGKRVMFESPEEQMVCINKLIGESNVLLDTVKPLAEARTYEGFRVSATYYTTRTKAFKITEDKYCDITIRKFKETPYTLAELCRKKTMTDNMARIMKLTINTTNQVICGVTGSGKTTTHRAELSYIKNNKRTLVIQQPSEIDLRKYDKMGNVINDVVQWEAEDTGKKGKQTNTLVNLIAHSLRNSPEIVVINEVRFAEEIWNLLLVQKEGHKTSTSLHSGTSKECIERIVNEICGYTHQDYKVVMKAVTQSLNLIMVQDKLEDGTRKILQMTEVLGCKGDEPLLEDIYVFVPNGKVIKDKNTGEIQEVCGEHKMLHNFSKEFHRKQLLKGVTEEELQEIEKYVVKDENSKTAEKYTGEGLELE